MTSKFRALLAALVLFGTLFAIVGAAPAYAQSQTSQPPPATSNPPAAQPGIWDALLGGDSHAATFAENLKSAQTTLGVGSANSSCWGCTIFDQFSAVTFQAGREVSSSAAPALRSLIAAFGAVFALFYLGHSFVSGDASDLLSRWKTFWALCIAVSVGSFWMTSAFDNTWNYIYGPLMSVPTEMLNHVPAGSSVAGGCAGGGGAPGAPAGAATVVTQMREVVCGAHKIGMKGMSYGLAMTMGGSGVSLLAPGGILAYVVNLVAGVIVMVMFGWLIVSFPLRFIDVLLRLCVVGIITPLLVVCAVFKPTRSYVSLGISNVLYAGLLFGFTGVMFKIGSTFFDNIAQQTIGAPSGDLTTMGALANAVIICGCAYIFSSIVNMAPGLASEFSAFRGSSGGVGSSAASFIQNVSTAPVKAGATVAGGVTQAVVAGRVMGAAMGRAAPAAAGSVAESLGKGVTS